MNKRSATGSLFWIGASMVVSVINYLLSIVLSWQLDPTDYGSIAVSQTFIFIGTWLLVSGFPRVGIQIMAGQPEERWHENYAVLRGVLLGNVTLSLLLGGLLALAYVQAWLPLSASYAALLSWAILTVVLLALRMTFDAVLQAQLRFGKLGMVRLIEVGLQFGTAILFVELGYGAAGALAGFAFGTGISLLVSIWYTRRVQFWRSGQMAFGRLTNALRPVWPMLVANLAGVLIVNLDVLAINFITQSDAITGSYQVAAVLARIPYFLVQTLIIIAFPMIAKQAGNLTEATAASRQALLWTCLGVVPLNLILFAGAEQTIRFFFPPIYVEATNALRVLSLGMICLCAALVLVAVCQARGKAYLAAYIMPLGMIVQLVTAALWIPADPLIGAAASVGLASVTVLLGMAIAVASTYPRVMRLQIRPIISLTLCWLLLIIAVFSLPILNRVLTALWISGSTLLYVISLAVADLLDWRPIVKNSWRKQRSRLSC